MPSGSCPLPTWTFPLRKSIFSYRPGHSNYQPGHSNSRPGRSRLRLECFHYRTIEFHNLPQLNLRLAGKSVRDTRPVHLLSPATALIHHQNVPRNCGEPRALCNANGQSVPRSGRVRNMAFRTQAALRVEARKHRPPVAVSRSLRAWKIDGRPVGCDSIYQKRQPPTRLGTPSFVAKSGD